MKNFDELLKKYADFIVRVGVNPQPGQVLIINCALEGAPLARLCVRSAFEAGARDVQVNWTDDAVTRTRMELGSEEALTDHKGWQLRRYLDYAESEGGVCVLHLIADDPELFAGLDGAKISRVNSANRSFMQPCQRGTFQRAVDDQGLSRLRVHTHPDDKICILLQQFVKVFHVKTSCGA